MHESLADSLAQQVSSKNGQVSEASIKQVEASMDTCLILASEPKQVEASIKQERASKGGRIRAAKLSPERRREIGQLAIRARWAKRREKTVIGFSPETQGYFQHD